VIEASDRRASFDLTQDKLRSRPALTPYQEMLKAAGRDPLAPYHDVQFRSVVLTRRCGNRLEEARSRLQRRPMDVSNRLRRL